jgi:hypothetical protein
VNGVEELTTHAVGTAGMNHARRLLINQNAADAVAALLPVDAREHYEGARLLRAAYERLFAVQHKRVAAHLDIRLVRGDVGAGMRLGHADRQQMLAAGDARQQPLLQCLRRIGGDDTRLRSDLAQHCHRGDVAALCNLLEDQRGVEDAKLHAAIGLRAPPCEDSHVREAADIFPGKLPVHELLAARLKFALNDSSDVSRQLPLFFAQLKMECGHARNSRWGLVSHEAHALHKNRRAEAPDKIDSNKQAVKTPKTVLWLQARGS